MARVHVFLIFVVHWQWSWCDRAICIFMENRLISMLNKSDNFGTKNWLQ